MFYVHGFVFGKFHLLIFIIHFIKIVSNLQRCVVSFGAMFLAILFYWTQECDFYAVAKAATVKSMLWGYVNFVCLC
jgi:hypothetical protein